MSNNFFSKLNLSRLTAGFGRKKPSPEERVNREYHATREQLLASLCRMLEPAQAEEVLQEAYIKLFIALQENKTLEPRPFLFRVARNLAISHLRHQKVIEQHGLRAGLALHDVARQETVEMQVRRQEEESALVAAINTLPPKCRQVFVMRKIDGHSHEEIAQILGISHKTVENHLARGMRLCREHLVTKQPASAGGAQVSETKEQRLAAG